MEAKRGAGITDDVTIINSLITMAEKLRVR